MKYSESEQRAHEKMMKEGTSTPICVKSLIESDSTSKGEVRVKIFTDGERTRRAIKTLAICWLLAAVCVFFPGVHFVAVPGFFLAGIIAPFFRYKVTSVVLGGEYTCPKCSHTSWIQANANDWPLRELCSNCGESVSLERVAEKSDS